VNGTQVTAGPELILSNDRNGNPQARSAALWTLTESSLVACFYSPETTSWTYKGRCDLLTVGDDLNITKQEGEQFIIKERADRINIEPLTDNTAIVCFSESTKNSAGKTDNYAKTSCAVLTVTNGATLSMGNAIVVNQHNTKDYADIAALGENKAVVCVAVGSSTVDKWYPPPDSRKKQVSCSLLTVSGTNLNQAAAALEIVDGEGQVDHLRSIGNGRALLSYSINPNIDWGINTVLSLDGDLLSKGDDVRPVTCWSGKGVATYLDFAVLSDGNVFVCYQRYSKTSCQEYAVESGKLGDKIHEPVTLDKKFKTHLVPLGSGRVLVCSNEADSAYGKAGGGCAVLSHVHEKPTTTLHEKPTTVNAEKNEVEVVEEDEEEQKKDMKELATLFTQLTKSLESAQQIQNGTGLKVDDLVKLRSSLKETLQKVVQVVGEEEAIPKKD
jgi:hypothetical protein